MTTASSASTASTVSTATTTPLQARPAGLVPEMLHHAGYVTRDAAKTADFYGRVLGMKFVSTVMDDKVPSTGEAFPYLHLFFELKDGSTIAFFESPSLPGPAAASHPAYKVFNHMAMQAASVAEVDTWAQWLRDNGVDVLGPVDHGIIYSIYFHDPDGNRLELTTTTDASWTDHATDAARDLEQWVEAKRRGAADGRGVGAALLELIQGKKAEMRARGIKIADELRS